MRRALASFDKIVSSSQAPKSSIIHNAQTASELALKAILDELDISYRTTHRMHDIVDRHQEALPDEVRTELNRLKDGLKWLSGVRLTAKYEHTDIPAEISEPSYSEEDVNRARNTTQEMINLASELIRE